MKEIFDSNDFDDFAITDEELIDRDIDNELLYNDLDNKYVGLTEDTYIDDDSGYDSDFYNMEIESDEVYHLLEKLKDVDEYLFNLRQYLANETDSSYDYEDVEEDMQDINKARRQLAKIASFINELSGNYGI